MRNRTIFAALAVLGAAALNLAAAASPFTGTWKFNASKSKANGQTTTCTAAGPNTWKFTYGSFTWTLKADGTDQPTPFGGTSNMTILSPTKWQFVNKVNGKITSTETWELAADGKTSTSKTSATRENGDRNDSQTVATRVGAGKGFEGTWRATNATFAAPEVLQLTDNGDSASGSFPADKSTWTCKFDGVECKVEGPKNPASLTISLKRVNPTTILATWKIDGKVVGTEDWKVAGNTLTVVEHDPGESVALVWGFDRQ